MLLSRCALPKRGRRLVLQEEIMVLQLSAAPSLFLRLVRCFNVAALVALSSFYFGMYCLAPPAAGPLVLVPQPAAAGATHP